MCMFKLYTLQFYMLNVYGLVRFRHENDFVRLRRRVDLPGSVVPNKARNIPISCQEYPVLSPLIGLENVPRSFDISSGFTYRLT